MSIKRTIITAVVLVAMVAVVAPVSAQTPTVAQLMAQMAQLQAQLAALQGGSSAPAATGTGACAGVTFSRNLTVGSTGQDVQCLQVILNRTPSTQVVTTGAGSPGMETMTFGPKTLAAVKAYQAANGLVPANQVGPKTRALLNAALGSVVVLPPPTTGTLPAGCTSTTGYSSTTGQPCNGTVTVTPSGTITAMLASDTPAAGAIVNGQATADLLNINFTGTGSVTSVTLQRSGISDQNALTNVYLYDGNTRLTSGYSFNVNGQIVMNGLAITVNGSHEISVRADVAGATNPISESSIAVALTSFTGNSTTTSSNVMGNTMAIVAGNLATATINGTITPAVSSNTITVNAGTTQYPFWSDTLQINVRAVLLKTANFEMIGSAPTNALANMTLLVDGVSTGKTGTVISIGGTNYINFDMTSAPITLTTGSHTIQINADVVNGSSRTVQLELQQASDLTITDPQVGVNIAVSGSGVTAGVVTIGAGQLTLNQDPAFTSVNNVSGGATNTVIGQFIIHPYGENIKVMTLPVSVTFVPTTTSYTTYTTGTGVLAVTSTTGIAAGNTIYLSNGAVTTTVTSVKDSTDLVIPTGLAITNTGTLDVENTGLNNVTLYFNGSQVGSQQNCTVGTGGNTTPVTGTTVCTLTPFQLGSQMIATAGQDSQIQVRADLQGAGANSYTGGSIYVKIGGSSTSAQGQSSQQTVSSFPNPQGNTLTLASGLLAISENSNYLNQSAGLNTPAVQIGSYIVQNQSTSESIRLTNLQVASTVTGTGATVYMSIINGLRTSDTTGSGSNPIQPSGGTGSTTSTDNFSVNDTLAPGASEVINILANTGSLPTGATSATIATTLEVTSIGSVDNITSTSSAISGQTITLGTGSLATPSIVVSSTTPSQYIASSVPTGAANSSQASYNFISNSGSSTINELKFTVTDSALVNGNSVTKICVTPTSGSAICAQPVAGVADLTGLSLVVPNGGGGLTANVQVSYSGVGTGGLNPSTTSTVALTYVKYTSGGTTAYLGVSPTISIPANQMTLVGSAPVVTVASTSNSGLILNTNQLVGQVTVAANASGQIRVNKLTFNVGSSGFNSTSMVLANPYIANGTTKITNVYCASTGTATLTSTVTCTFNADGTDATLSTLGYAYDYPISAGQSQTFSLYATVLGANTTAGAIASVSTSLKPDASSDTYSNSNGTFVWDDSSVNGTLTGHTSYGDTANGTGLTGYLIYNFPTSSYTIHQ